MPDQLGSPAGHPPRYGPSPARIKAWQGNGHAPYLRRKMMEKTMTDEKKTLEQAATDQTPVRKPPVKQPPGEIGGPAGPEPTRFGDWEFKGRCSDF
ncbi:hypothetical protein GCM10011317_30360 [Niveispirillum cyanobacteriorum]|nr:hypothetical protein GCM10011317_30360 [Niveispirillum cyanobacteriorum]